VGRAWFLFASPYKGRQTLFPASRFWVEKMTCASKFAKVGAIVFRPSGAREILIDSESHGSRRGLFSFGPPGLRRS